MNATTNISLSTYGGRRTVQYDREYYVSVTKSLFVILAVILLISVLINVFTLLTLCKEKSRNATVMMFIFVSVVDILCCCIGLFGTIVHILQLYPDLGINVVSVFRRYILYVDGILFMICYITVVIVSVERLFAVFRPNDFRTIWTPKMASLTVGLVYFFTVCSGITAIIISFNTFRNLRMCFVGGSVTLVAVFNFITVYGLKRQLSKIKPRADGTGTERVMSSMLAKEKKQTKVLIVISVLFSLSGTIIFLTILYQIIYPPYPGSIMHKVVVFFKRLMQTTYGVFNGIIFIAANKRFRNYAKEAIQCR